MVTAMYRSIVLAAVILVSECQSFTIPAFTAQLSLRTTSKNTEHAKSKSYLCAAPTRLEDNVDGVLYVNSKCINCSACHQFAPQTFDYSPRHNQYVVKQQPSLTTDPTLLHDARAALSACPVSAIRVENTAQRQHRGDAPLSPAEEDLAHQLAIHPRLNGLEMPFPRRIPLSGPMESVVTVDDGPIEPVIGVFYLGHHTEKSFGAVPYLVCSPRGSKVMIDVPRYSQSAIRTVISLCGEQGPQYLFLTHVDDVAEHNKWKERFPSLKRIFHQGDLGRYNWLNDLTLEGVEVLLEGQVENNNEEAEGEGDGVVLLKAWTLDGEEIEVDVNGNSNSNTQEEFVIFHTPGHSPGSISLLYHPQNTPCADPHHYDYNYNQGILFTGDTLGYSNRLKKMTGFPRYGNDLKTQAVTLRQLLKLDWTFVAPGHGMYRDYSHVELGVKEMEIRQAINDLY